MDAESVGLSGRTSPRQHPAATRCGRLADLGFTIEETS
jgi:hypothetical protein